MMNELQTRVIEKIKKTKIIAILRALPEEKIIPTVKAIIDGGVDLVEVTFDHTSKEQLEKTPRMIKTIKEHFGDSVEVGAGTVLDCNDLCMAKDAGATFLISPNCDEKVIKTTKKFGLVSLPGAYTPSEICNAYNWGADFVKIFPIIGNPEEYIKAVKAPLKHIPVLAVGGVNLDNTAAVLKAGAAGIGIGSGLVKAAEVEKYESEEDYKAITERAQKYVAIVNSL